MRARTRITRIQSALEGLESGAAGAENIYDKLKSQWGRWEFTTKLRADTDHGKNGDAHLQLVDVVWADVRRGASPGNGDESGCAFGGRGKDDQVRRTPDLERESATRKKRGDTEAHLKYQQDLTKF